MKTQSPNATGFVRSGATLTEVLMAVLIMGIGVISVISLFPISLVRIVHAHLLTSATDLRYNAEQTIEHFPRIYQDPDGDGRFGLPAGTIWTNYFVDPHGVLKGIPASYSYGGTLFVKRFDGGLFTERTTEYFMNDNDSWNTQFEGEVNSIAGSGLEANITNSDKANVTVSAELPLVRLILVNPATKRSITRIVTEIRSGGIVNWNEDLDSDNMLDVGEDIDGNGRLDINPITEPVPAGTRALLQVLDRRFSWVLTVRPRIADADFYEFDIDVVTFNNRAFDPVEELIFDNGGSLVFDPAATRPDQIIVQYTAPDKPIVSRGGFVFDLENAYWYSIRDYRDTGSSFEINLDAPVRGESKSALFWSQVINVFPLGTKMAAEPKKDSVFPE